LTEKEHTDCVSNTQSEQNLFFLGGTTRQERRKCE